MRPTSLFIIAGLIVGAFVLDQPAHAQAARAAETIVEARSGVAVPLFVGAGLVGMAIGTALALVVTGNGPSQPSEAALPAHRPDRPSPDRDFPDAETIAALFAEPAPAANGGHA